MRLALLLILCSCAATPIAGWRRVGEARYRLCYWHDLECRDEVRAWCVKQGAEKTCGESEIR